MKRVHDIENMNRNNFRSSLEALARPGEIQALQPLFNSPLLAMASVFLYAEVSHHYNGGLDFDLIRALCGSPAAEAGEADYLFFDEPASNMLKTAKTGTVESPEKSATLVFAYAPEHLQAGVPVCISGPGIRGATELTLPVDTTFIGLLREKNEHFPLGVDLFFVSWHNQLLGLPRTTYIEVVQ